MRFRLGATRLGNATPLGNRDRRPFLVAQGGGSASATALAGKAGLRATYLAMAASAAVIAVAVGFPLVRRAGLRRAGLGSPRLQTFVTVAGAGAEALLSSGPW